MRALVLEDGVLRLQERESPEPGPGQARVRVSVAGICNTDLEIARGYMGFSGVLGHELCGVVDACDDARWVGRRVAGEINLACGDCDTCNEGLGRHCPNRSTLGILGKDGCFAEHVTLPVVNLHPIPDAIDDEVATFVEPTAAAFEILEQAPLRGRERVAVLGDGKLGLLIAQVLHAEGAEVTLVGRHPHKLALARARGVATAAPGELPERRFDRVVEATGAPEGMRAALALLRPRGLLVLKSTYHGALSLDAAPLVIDEITLLGSRCGPFAPAIEALADGRVDPRPMIDERFALDQGVAAFERAAAPGVLKVLLRMG